MSRHGNHDIFSLRLRIVPVPDRAFVFHEVVRVARCAVVPGSTLVYADFWARLLSPDTWVELTLGHGPEHARLVDLLRRLPCLEMEYRWSKNQPWTPVPEREVKHE